MAQVQYYGTGRRKHSVARVRLVPGEGRIIINKRDINEYFGLETLKLIVKQPLNLTDTLANTMFLLLLMAAVFPVKLALSVTVFPVLCLKQIRNSVRLLKRAGFLTRDPRMKERKKYGLKAARRAPQFSKR